MGNSSVRSFMGFIMFVGGLYLMLSAIRIDVGSMFRGGRHALFNVGGYGVTSGAILIVLMLGIGMLFFNARNPIGWMVTVGAVACLIFGVIFNAQMSLYGQSAFSLIVILVMLCGGLGLMLSGMVGGRRER